MGADEFSFELWLAILKEQFDYLLEVGEKLIDGCPLGVGTGPTRDMPYKQACIRIALYYGCEGSHNTRYELTEPKNTTWYSGLSSARSQRFREWVEGTHTFEPNERE